MPLDPTLKKWLVERITTVDEEINFLQAYIGTLPAEIVAERIVKHELEKKHLEEWLEQQGVLIKRKPRQPEKFESGLFLNEADPACN